MWTKYLRTPFLFLVLTLVSTSGFAEQPVFPGEDWDTRQPEEMDMASDALEAIGSTLGGRGCIIKDGYRVYAWGDQEERSDWLSSAKPVLSTLLFFAIEEGRVTGVHHRLADLGWALSEKDQPMELYHLANMISGYARPDAPGAAWAYNDFAIQLYQKTLFDKIFPGDPNQIGNAPNRLGALGLQDGLNFREGNRRISASVRDFARIAWFWCNKGNWNGRQLLPSHFFDEYMKPQVSSELPHTQRAETDDYLGIGSYGGGSDHFTEYGSGIYGFNWWFNATGRLHPDTITWPDAPSDTFMSIGAGGNNTVIIPSLGIVLASAKGNWGSLSPGDRESTFNAVIQTLVESARGDTEETSLSVHKWEPFELSFASAAKQDNPFAVPFTATFRGPEDTQLETIGFHDGEGVWKVRASLDRPGEWTMETHSTDPDLNGHARKVRVLALAKPNEHGPYQIDAKHPHHFVHADGTRFFHLGYECDWLWALDLGKENPDETTAFLDRLKSFGFNAIILNVYAHDTSWREGNTVENDFGPPFAYPWEGTNADPDHSRLNLAFWSHYDRVIRAMHDRGIQAHVMIKVYNKKVKWPKRGSNEEELFLQTVVGRYAAYTNVVWDFSKESYNEKDSEYKVAFIEKLREFDPYDRLITVHDDDALYGSGAYSGLIDFHSDQQHGEWHEKIAEQRSRRNWPVVNVEYGYEWGPGGESDKTYGVAQSPEENARRAWLITMAGGYTTYYYTYTAWDVLYPQHVPAGYAMQRNLKTFFEGTKYWLMDPRDDLVSTGHCLARPGKEYVVFLEEPGSVQVARDEASATPMLATWYHPYTGETRPAAEEGGLGYTSPADWRAAPAVLWLR
ncbi:MAG: hypothetical protein AMXMBFR84_48960 [Candidatus Hydrogenedentota bacterium]